MRYIKVHSQIQEDAVRYFKVHMYSQIQKDAMRYIKIVIKEDVMRYIKATFSFHKITSQNTQMPTLYTN